MEISVLPKECMDCTQILYIYLCIRSNAICGEPNLTKHYLLPMASNLRIKNPSVIPHNFVNQTNVLENYYIYKHKVS